MVTEQKDMFNLDPKFAKAGAQYHMGCKKEH